VTGTPVVVALGSNVPPRRRTLDAAVARLARLPGTRLVASSPWRPSAPLDPPPGVACGEFLNGACLLHTTLAPRALLDALLAIERAQGRRRSGVRNEARTLDLDLLLYGDQQIDEPGLVVPHPRLALRPFVLEPLRELTPALVVPGTGASVATLAARVRDPAAARRYEP